MINSMRALVALGVLMFTYNVNANSESEISHLLKFVENTPCQYERNGDLYQGQEAATHIQKKYTYYQDDIKISEDFIRLAASKSSISGKVYMVHCPNQPSITSAKWLTLELKRFRGNSQNQ